MGDIDIKTANLISHIFTRKMINTLKAVLIVSARYNCMHLVSYADPYLLDGAISNVHMAVVYYQKTDLKVFLALLTR